MKKWQWPKDWQYAKVPKKMLFCEAWKKLSQASRTIYSQLKGKYNYRNNGEITLCYSELKCMKGLKGTRAIARGFLELEEEGWIETTTRGGMYGRSSKYRLTGKYDESIIWDQIINDGKHQK